LDRTIQRDSILKQAPILPYGKKLGGYLEGIRPEELLLLKIHYNKYKISKILVLSSKNKQSTALRTMHL
jgi:hypothetical protein